MTAQQIKWAEQHDWFVKVGRYHVVGRESLVTGVLVKHDTIEGETLIFTDYQALREWAGY